MDIIENNFHVRKVLAPNICAVYVEEVHRRQGIAGIMLGFVSYDMMTMGNDTLYSVTSHMSFYEDVVGNFYSRYKDTENWVCLRCIFIDVKIMDE